MKTSEIKKTLEKLLAEDQKDISDFKVGVLSSEDLVSRNKKRQQTLERIVCEVGWPKQKELEKDACTAAFLIVQHSDDLQFQKKCLKRMRKLSEGEIDKKHPAYLEDRILVSEGKNQKYGTQFCSEIGKIKLYPIDDQRNVDERREKVGLEPLDLYVKKIATSQTHNASHTNGGVDNRGTKWGKIPSPKVQP